MMSIEWFFDDDMNVDDDEHGVSFDDDNNIWQAIKKLGDDVLKMQQEVKHKTQK